MGPRWTAKGLRGLLALALVPVVVLAVPNVARAAEVAAYGSWKKAAAQSDRLIDLIKGVDYLRVECTMAARYKVTSTTQYAEFREGVCTSYSDSVKEGKPFDLTMRGKTSTGADCSGLASGTFGGSTSWLGVAKRATFSGTVLFDPVVGPQLEQGCHVTDWTLSAPGNSFWDGSVSMAGSLDLGTMPSVNDPAGAPTGGACGWGWEKATFESCINVGSGYPLEQARYTFNWTSWMREKANGADRYNGMWLFRRGTVPAPGTVIIPASSTTADIQKQPGGAGVVRTFDGSVSYPLSGLLSQSRPAAGQPDDDLVAVKVEIRTPGYWHYTIREPHGARMLVKAHGSTTTDPGTWSSEPPTVIGDGNEADPVDSAPVDERDGCGFKWSDPTTYASAGICAVVSMLTKIWETLKGLPGDIVDGVRDVFVPGAGVIEAELGDIQDAWSDTAPVALADAVGQIPGWLVEPAGGGCQGLAMGPISFGMDTDPVTFRPFSTCASERAALANVVRIGLMVMVYVGAGLAALRIVGSSLGVDLSIGKGEDT